MVKKTIMFLLCLALVVSFLSACAEDEGRTRDRTKTIVLDEDTILYENPDGRSAEVGIFERGEKVDYSSSKKVDGIKWYETDQGWFSVFVPTDHKGHVISAGFAKKDLDLYSGAAASASVVGKVDIGAYLEVYQVRDLWAQTANGWVLSDQLYIAGQMGEHSGWCLTLKQGVSCYSQPKADSMKVTDYRALYRLKLYEILTVDGVRWGYTDNGWINLENAYVEGETGEGACHVKVVDTTPLNVRVGPGTGYDVVKTLASRSYTDILFQVQTDNDYWGFMGDGWIYMGLVKVEEG